MKTQDQIVERIKSTKTTHVHANALLGLFLDRPHQILVLGSRIASELPMAVMDEFRQELAPRDIGPMLVDLIGQAREWEPVGGSDENDRIQRIRKERMEALVWLIEDDSFFDWTRSLRDLLAEIEARYTAGAGV